MGGEIPALSRLPAIARRLGVDRSPVDLSVEENVRWLLACIWPGTERDSRAQAAMRLLAERAPLIRRGDMVDDLPAALTEMKPLPAVVVTAWSFSYLSPQDRSEFQAILQEEGRRNPVAWVCADALGVCDLFQPVASPPAGESMPCFLGAVVFDGHGADPSTLAYVHPHGAWIRWLGEGERKGIGLPDEFRKTACQ
jgi:hypothetical protein